MSTGQVPSSQPPLPKGFSLGDPASPQWGSSYFTLAGVKMKVAGIWQSAGGMYRVDLDDEGGTLTTQVTYISESEKQLLDAAQNAQFFSREHQMYAIEVGGETSTDPAMKALLTDPEYQALIVDSGGQSPSAIYASMSPGLKKLFEATIIYRSMVSTGEAGASGTGSVTTSPSLGRITTGGPSGSAGTTTAPTSAPTGPTGAPALPPGAQPVIDKAAPIVQQVRDMAQHLPPSQRGRFHGFLDALETLVKVAFHLG